MINFQGTRIGIKPKTLAEHFSQSGYSGKSVTQRQNENMLYGVSSDESLKENGLKEIIYEVLNAYTKAVITIIGSEVRDINSVLNRIMIKCRTAEEIVDYARSEKLAVKLKESDFLSGAHIKATDLAIEEFLTGYVEGARKILASLYLK